MKRSAWNLNVRISVFFSVFRISLLVCWIKTTTKGPGDERIWKFARGLAQPCKWESVLALLVVKEQSTATHIVLLGQVFLGQPPLFIFFLPLVNCPAELISGCCFSAFFLFCFLFFFVCATAAALNTHIICQKKKRRAGGCGHEAGVSDGVLVVLGVHKSRRMNCFRRKRQEEPQKKGQATCIKGPLCRYTLRATPNRS